ncbi:MAG: lysozyme inhibitor LprI family protein [Porticoccaceae bacterium]
MNLIRTVKRYFRNYMILLAIIPVSVLGADEDYCYGMSGFERSDCLRIKLELAETQMKLELEAALEHMSGQDFIPIEERLIWQNKLIESQKTWLLYRDQGCDAKTSNWSGAIGSSMGNIINACWVDVTLDRVKRIRNTYIKI